MSEERRRDLESFEEEYNLDFNDINLLNLAFTHSSYSNEHSDGTDSNERFEFLGDSILDLIVAEYLFGKYYDQHDEGDFSKIKAMVVSEDSLSEIAHSMHFEKYILTGKGEESSGGKEKKAIQADAMEAVIASIYLDKGLGACRTFVLSFISDEIEKIMKDEVSYKDYKTKLQIFYQKKTGRTPRYVLERTEGPDHDRTFFVEVYLDNNVFGVGEGKNKKQAEQDAARQALINLKLEK